MAEKNTAGIGFEKQIWDARVYCVATLMHPNIRVLCWV